MFTGLIQSLGRVSAATSAPTLASSVEIDTELAA